MSVTAAHIARLRRMVNESTEDTYTDLALSALIESHAISDMRGVAATVLDFSTTPPSEDANTNWIPTYDLNAAAAEIWDEKAAVVACDFDFSADGASYTRSQVIAQYNKMATKYRSQARPGVLRAVKTQRELTSTGVVVETTPIIDRYDDDGVINN